MGRTLDEWRRDPFDHEGNAVSRPFVNVGAVEGAEESVLRHAMPDPLGGGD